MRRFWTVALLMVASVAGAGAMEQASTPPKFPIAWGASAGSAYVRSIPVPSQIGIQNCAASLTDGFPPLTFVPASAGGCPPFGQDFNGILKQATQWAQWQQAGGPVYYDSAFAAGIGGYPRGAILQSSVVPGNRWLSTADNNATNPDSDSSAGWVQDPSQVPTGTPMQSLSSTVPTGYVASNANTIGNASSNATGLASATTVQLFKFLWANCDNVECPIVTSAGAPTTRGASASADYAANKALTTPGLRGAGMVGADTMGGGVTTWLTGVPVTNGSATVPTSILGENFHSLTAAENGVHAHANTLTDPGHAHANTLTDPGHTHANTLTDPGHTHVNTLTDPGHVHGVTVTDPGHTHSNTLSDPGHVHAVPITDPGHNHLTGITQAQFNISSGGVGPFLFGASIGGGVSSTIINNNTTGITATASSHATGVTINNASAGTGISAGANSNVTGLSINNASRVTGATVSNVSASTGLSVNNASASTGLSVNNANAGSGTGHNTVSRAVVVWWNLKL